MELLDEVDGFPEGSAEPGDALTTLKSASQRSIRVNNRFLEMKPKDMGFPCGSIHGNSRATRIKVFYVDDLRVLKENKMYTADGEYWEKVKERGQGWGVAGDRGWDGLARAFFYNPRQPSNSNKTWYLKVYAAFDADGYIKPLYKCYVFETYHFNPRPKCVSQLSAADADNPDTIQEDPVEVESLAKKLEDMATNPNLLPYGERSIQYIFRFPSIGVDKNLRAGVWKSGKFSRIKARCPGGGEICWSLCNHCGMLYKGSTLAGGIEKHKCDCSCRPAPNS